MIAPRKTLSKKVLLSFLYINLVASAPFAKSQEETLDMENPATYEAYKDSVELTSETDKKLHQDFLRSEPYEMSPEEKKAQEWAEQKATPYSPSELLDMTVAQKEETYAMERVQIAIAQAKLRACAENPALYGKGADFQILQPFLSVDGKKIHTQEELEDICERKIVAFGDFSNSQLETHPPAQLE